MSDIDTFDHELVGFFGGIPIYHPLILHRAYFTAEWVEVAPNQLIIGGGSGEHPAVILLKPEFAVALFILEWLDFMETKRAETLAKLPIDTKQWKNGFIEQYWASESGNVFQFAGWSPDNYHNFIERCRSEKFFRPLNTGSLINWLAASLGEFIFCSMPELIPKVDEYLPGARDYVLGGRYMNVLIPPQGYRFPEFGHKFVDGKMQHGIRWKSSQT